jgi:hypothetical protein
LGRRRHLSGPGYWNGGLLGLIMMAGLGSGIILRNLAAANIFFKSDTDIHPSQSVANP